MDLARGIVPMLGPEMDAISKARVQLLLTLQKFCLECPHADADIICKPLQDFSSVLSTVLKIAVLIIKIMHLEDGNSVLVSDSIFWLSRQVSSLRLQMEHPYTLHCCFNNTQTLWHMVSAGRSALHGQLCELP